MVAIEYGMRQETARPQKIFRQRTREVDASVFTYQVLLARESSRGKLGGLSTIENAPDGFEVRLGDCFVERNAQSMFTDLAQIDAIGIGELQDIAGLSIAEIDRDRVKESDGFRRFIFRRDPGEAKL